MKKFLSVVGSLASIVALGFFIYFQFIYIPTIELEIKTIEIQELTKLPTDQNLKVQFFYKDSTIDRLYRHKYLIANSGTKTIVGSGTKRDLISNNLPLNIESQVKSLLDARIGESNFPVSINDSNLKFKQWRIGESFELILYSEDSASWNGIDERDIVNAKVVYSKYEPLNENKPQRLIDRFPKGTVKFFWWIVVIEYGILLIATIITVNTSFKNQEPMGIGLKIFVLIIILALSVFFYLPILWMV